MLDRNKFIEACEGVGPSPPAIFGPRWQFNDLINHIDHVTREVHASSRPYR